jgi:RNA polymerase sigma factor (sigma-70 family)
MDPIPDPKQIFLKLILENQGLISSVCRIYYNQEEDIKDVRQDIVFQLWKSLPMFRNECKVSTWIYRVAIQTILSKKRKEKRFHFERPISEADTNIPTPPFADDDLQQLKHIIGQLEDIDKAIVVLYLEGYCHKEIAAIVKSTQTNISTRMNRIKTRLRNIYKASQHEYR